MFGMGPSEMIVILIVALLVFGRRLPEVSRSLGRTMREFKKGLKEGVSSEEGGSDPKIIDAPRAEGEAKKDDSARTSA